MKKGMWLGVLTVMVVASVAIAGWNTAGWKYNDGDLYGATSLQVAVDDLDTRLDAAGVTTTPTSTLVTSVGAAGHVYALQPANVAAKGATVTNTFSPVFISTPIVVWQYTAGVFVSSNVTTIATGSVIIAGANTNLALMAYGRIK